MIGYGGENLVFRVYIAFNALNTLRRKLTLQYCVLSVEDTQVFADCFRSPRAGRLFLQLGEYRSSEPFTIGRLPRVG